MPPPLGFNLPPPSHAPAASLSLARSRPSGPPSISGASASSRASSEGRSSKPMSPRTPNFTPHSRDDDDNEEEEEEDATPSIPLLPVTPVDPAAWAENVAPSFQDADSGGGGEGGRRGSRPRVQFAPDASVALFDVEDDEEGSFRGMGDGEFEKPTRHEIAWIILSVVAVTAIGAAAVLATLYDWVL